MDHADLSLKIQACKRLSSLIESEPSSSKRKAMLWEQIELLKQIEAALISLKSK